MCVVQRAVGNGVQLGISLHLDVRTELTPCSEITEDKPRCSNWQSCTKIVSTTEETIIHEEKKEEKLVVATTTGTNGLRIEIIVILWYSRSF